MSLRVYHWWSITGLAIAFWCCTAQGAYYNRQTYPGQGVAGVVGSGSLSMSNQSSTVYVGFTKGAGSFTDNLVMFIDCAPGGYTNTAVFNNKDNALETAISGCKFARSIANFAPGFEADYAVVVGVNNGCGVYKLVDDGAGPNLQLIRNFNIAPPGDPNTPIFYWQFGWADIGLPNANTNFFKFETSLISANGYRYVQSFEGITGTEGYNTVTFTNYDTYGVQPVPENTAVGLAIFGGLAGSVVLIRRLRRTPDPKPIPMSS